MPCRSTDAFDADASAHRKGPAFTPEEQDVIARWAAAMRERGLRTRIDRDHEFLGEAVHVTQSSINRPEWLVHKTPAGAVAVRLWPGLADIVATLPDTLAIISAAAEQADG